jgi:hypothetical protein
MYYKYTIIELIDIRINEREYRPLEYILYSWENNVDFCLLELLIYLLQNIQDEILNLSDPL